jgi:sortase (surface protein transpeptidase)
MSLIRVIFELLVLYLVYKLIFDFIIPVYKTTKQVKQKVGEMQSQMNEQRKQEQNNQFTSETKEHTAKPRKEDYIEFEEVK